MEQLQKLLVRNVRLLAQLGVCPVAHDRALARSQMIRLRSQINDNFVTLESQADAVRFEVAFRRRREQDVADSERFQRAQPALRSIYLLELSLLSHRGRRETGSELTQQQNDVLDHFLNEYSHELMHIAAWIAREEDAPARLNDDSVLLSKASLRDQSSPNSRAISDICLKMVSSLLILRNEC